MPEELTPEQKAANEGLQRLVSNVAAETATRIKAELAAERQSYVDRVNSARTNEARVAAINENPLAQVVLPLLADPLRQVTFKADNAADKAEFYTMNPQLGKYRAQIEDVVAATAKSGQAWSRQTAYEWVRGHNYDQFKEADAQADADAKAASARDGLVAGPGGISRNDQFGIGTMEDFMKLSHEEKGKRLEGISF